LKDGLRPRPSTLRSGIYIFWPNENPKRDSRYPLSIKFVKENEVQYWGKQKITLYWSGIIFYGGLNYLESDKKQWLFKKI